MATFYLEDLLSSEEYFVKGYFFIAENNEIKEFSHQFKTLGKDLKNGELKLKFSELTFREKKRWMLCKISESYSIPIENVWSNEGINCLEKNEIKF